MSIAEQLHKSKFHRDGFDPNCPKCLQDDGIEGLIRHLESCADLNEADVRAGDQGDGPSVIGPDAVAHEQRRMIGILKLYRKVGGGL